MSHADNLTHQPIPGSTTYRDSAAYLGPHDDQTPDAYEIVPDVGLPDDGDYPGEAQMQADIADADGLSVALDELAARDPITRIWDKEDAAWAHLAADGPAMTIEEMAAAQRERHPDDGMTDTRPSAPDRLVLCPACRLMKRVGYACPHCGDKA